MHNVIYIHGANADADNFNYYKLILSKHESISPEYSMDENPYDLVENIKQQKEREFGKKPVILVGHSFGGILAGWFASVYHADVKHLITIATPWHGTPVARIFGWVFADPEWKHNKPNADVLNLLQKKQYVKPHTNIVCTKGSNAVAGIGGKSNDGMIPCDSQIGTPPKFTKTQNIHIEAGHSGVLLNNSVTDLLRDIIEE